METTSGDRVLEEIAEGVARVAGFGVAAIGLVRAKDLEIVAVAGPEEARAELLGTRTPLAQVLGELEVGEDWGPLVFVPHESLREEPWGWIPDVEPVDDPDAWHPLDALCAPLRSTDGRLLGLLSIDLPVDGRRPGPDRQRLLGEYAAQAGTAALLALEREALSEHVRLGRWAREIVRNAPTDLGVDKILEVCGEALVAAFDASGLWMQLFDGDRRNSGLISRDQLDDLPPELVDLAERAARLSWARQRAEVVAHGLPRTDYLAPEEAGPLLAFLDSIQVESLLFVPLGAGAECLGNLVLTRVPGGPEWSEAERSAALDIGHDLGRVVLNARAFERERRTNEELRALDIYKSQLIATVSHELKNPLAAISGHLEILEEEDASDTVRSSLAAMDRGTRRLTRVVDDLLLLARVGDPDHPVSSRPVDLRDVVTDAMELGAVAAKRKRLRVAFAAPRNAAVALGDPEELDRLVSNLLSNAVKYTPEGGQVQVDLAQERHEVVLAVTDSGIGISPEDQAQLFSEFFRSSNPVALSQPGTGLGLAIVHRIVTRHAGSVEVESTLGEGSTFRVRLPAAT